MNKILKFIIFIWIILWLLFIIRPLFKQKYLEQYIKLIGKPLEERRAYVYKEELYDFLKFCQIHIPLGSTYKLVGLKEDSVDKVRAVYYLYPNIINLLEPQFILVFNLKNYREPAYRIYTLMNEANYILIYSLKK